MSVIQIDGCLHYIGISLEELPTRRTSHSISDSFATPNPSRVLTTMHQTVQQVHNPMELMNRPMSTRSEIDHPAARGPFQSLVANTISSNTWKQYEDVNPNLSTFARLESQMLHSSAFDHATMSDQCFSAVYSNGDFLGDADSPRWSSDTEQLSSSENDASGWLDHTSELLIPTMSSFYPRSDVDGATTAANGGGTFGSDAMCVDTLDHWKHSFQRPGTFSGDGASQESSAATYAAPQMFFSTLDSLSPISNSAPVFYAPSGVPQW